MKNALLCRLSHEGNSIEANERADATLNKNGTKKSK
jgi:hypothetical protein